MPFNVAICVKLFGTYRILRRVGGLLVIWYDLIPVPTDYSVCLVCEAVMMSGLSFFCRFGALSQV